MFEIDKIFFNEIYFYSVKAKHNDSINLIDMEIDTCTCFEYH